MFKVTIETGNDAFADDNPGAEIARILRELAKQVEREAYPCPEFYGNLRLPAAIDTGLAMLAHKARLARELRAIGCPARMAERDALTAVASAF